MEKAAPGLTMLQVGLDAGSSPVHLLETPFNVLVVVVKLCGARPAEGLIFVPLAVYSHNPYDIRMS